MADSYDVKRLLMVPVRRWRAVVAVALIPTLIVGVLVMLVAPRRYSCTATLLVAYEKPSAVVQDAGKISDYLASLPGSPLAAYQALLANPAFVRGIWGELGLDKSPWKADSSRVRGIVRLVEVPNANLINVVVSFTDATKAAEIANAFAQGFAEWTNGLIKTQPAEVVAEVPRQFHAAAKTLQASEKALGSIRAQQGGVEELTAMQSGLIADEAAYRSALTNLQVQRDMNGAILANKQVALAHEPTVLVTRKSIINDPALMAIAESQSGLSAEQLASLVMRSEEMNPVWESLRKDIVSLQVDIASAEKYRVIYEAAVQGIEKKLAETSAQLEDRKAAVVEAERAVSLAQRQYDLAVATYESVINVSENAVPPIRVVLNATPADHADGDRTLKVAFAFLASLLLGVVCAYVADAMTPPRSPGDKAGT
ncbi:MAG TPA: hypothetical protein VN478_01785 [Clostridia bacterium]|nr:hypothetical protein [Clostridia bacterium]